MTNVLVTGGTGFLGKHLRSLLTEKGHTVYAFGSTAFDLRDPSHVRKLVKETVPSDIDVVYHLAADVGGIHYNSAHPGSTFYNNAMMGINLLHACSQYLPNSHFVCVGSVCAYPKFTPVPFREDMLWEGYPEESNGPYGIAKRLLHTMASGYREQYNYRSSYVLLTNLYGPGDDFDPSSSHVIPALIRKIDDAQRANRDTIHVWGSGNASRDFIYVSDAARGLMRIADKYDSSKPINLGSGEEVSIHEIVEILCNTMGYRGVCLYDRAKPDGQPRRMLDTRRMDALGWLREVSLPDGLARTVRWYKQQVEPVLS